MDVWKLERDLLIDPGWFVLEEVLCGNLERRRLSEESEREREKRSEECIERKSCVI